VGHVGCGVWGTREAGDAATLEPGGEHDLGFKKDPCLHRRFLSLENGKKVWYVNALRLCLDHEKKL
jgi:hypothetical protein